MKRTLSIYAALALVSTMAMATTESTSKEPVAPTAASLAPRQAPKPAILAPASKTLPSGLVITTVKEGTGSQPTSTSNVQVHYRGTLENGTEFDSSYKRGQPATFPLNRVIPCWTEGVALMKEGGKAVLMCPPKIAYGAAGAGAAVPPNATLRFEVELLQVK